MGSSVLALTRFLDEIVKILLLEPPPHDRVVERGPRIE